MKKINWKILNVALWAELVLIYLLPFQITEHSDYLAGFPIPFLSVHAGKPGINPFMSMHLNPLGLLADGMILYLLLLACIRIYRKFRSRLRRQK